MRHVPVLLDMSEPRVLANGQNLEKVYRKEVLLIPARLVALHSLNLVPPPVSLVKDKAR